MKGIVKSAVKGKTLLRLCILIVVMSVLAVKYADIDMEQNALAKKRPGALNLATAKVVDLTHILHEKVPLFPGGKNTKAEATAGYDDGYYARRFECDEHTGTHIDAPAHFAPGKNFVHQLKPQDLFAPLVVIDVEAKVRENPDYLLMVDDINAWEKENGGLPRKAFVVMKSGWERRWDSQESYLNKDDAGVMHFPGFSLEAAQYLDKKGVVGIGIDTLSLDYGPTKDFSVHVYFLGKNKYMVENLVNLGELPAKGAYVLIAPLKIKNGSGAPARVLALTP